MKESNARARESLVNSGPVASQDFKRILALPRRLSGVDVPEETALVTEWLKRPGGVQTLRGAQARAIVESVDKGGMVCTLGVGHGKTLISFLVCEAFRRERGTKRPLILVPSALAKDTEKRLSEARKNWEISCDPVIMGHARLGVVSGADLLDKLQPDLIVIDECHAFRAHNTGRTRRLKSYMKTAKPHFVGLSGTLFRSSLLDYWQFLLWALGPADAPVPLSFYEASQWASALKQDAEVPPGVLEQFAKPGELPTDGFARRVRETVGVVGSNDPSVGCSLEITLQNWTSPLIEKAMRQVDETWEMPGGEMMADATQVAALSSMVALGFYHKLVFKKGEDKDLYTTARRAWASFCKSILSRGIKGIDTELAVANAVDSGAVKGGKEELEEWRRVRVLKPESVAVWFDKEFLVERVKAWLKKGHAGIVWVRNREPGLLLSRELSLPWYGSGTGAEIEKEKGRSLVASIAVHGTGRELQAWNRMLVTTPAPKAVEWEQLLGRLHRAGQQADSVSCDVIAGTEWATETMDRARAHAEWLSGQAGFAQRLCIARIVESS